MARRGFWSLVWLALRDLFDQATGFGRLAAVHVGMMAGDTLVTVSLAGSLFFSVSPTEAKGKVLAYLALTFAPFAVVSPLLGPVIDRPVHGRRAIVAASAGSRVLLCWFMSRHLNSWLLFPEAFAMLVASKLYVVTRGTLVPEMARSNQFRTTQPDSDAAGWPLRAVSKESGFAGYNAQLTLLGTGAGLAIGVIGAAVLHVFSAPVVLIMAAVMFAYTTIASMRLPSPQPISSVTKSPWHPTTKENDHVEVQWGLASISTLRFSTGFLGFLLVFGLRSQEASLSWYGGALAMTALGSLVGLAIVTRTHGSRADTTLLTWSHLLVAAACGALWAWPSLFGQVALSAVVGLSGSIAQPSFDSITQQHVPMNAQGRSFARFAVRQQLLWVIGAIVPVAIDVNWTVGNASICVLSAIVGLTYGFGRRYVSPTLPPRRTAK
ncbi:MAG: hypothetical protein KJS64_07210 [Acidobacteria bacterium]|nr:hypothetical protein [Acidobacteriota bacterium]